MKNTTKEQIHPGEPSAAYVFAGFCSFLFPGLGQLLLDRIPGAFWSFVFASMGWAVAIMMITGTGTVYSHYQPSLIQMMVGMLIGLMPHILAAYYAANGHKP